MQKYFENKGTSPMYVGNTMIPPGEGKVVEVMATAPREPAPAPEGPSLVDLIGALLDKPVAQIVLELPGLTHEALDLAESQEQGGKTRKTLLAAIQAERIARADAKLQGDQDAAAEEALAAARNDLLSARVALLNLHEDSAERTTAQAAVNEAQAKVDALAPAAG